LFLHFFLSLFLSLSVCVFLFSSFSFFLPSSFSSVSHNECKSVWEVDLFLHIHVIDSPHFIEFLAVIISKFFIVIALCRLLKFCILVAIDDMR
jgi:hypothetical protein